VRWNGARARLAGVASGLHKLGADAKIVLDAEGDASWRYVQWTLALLMVHATRPVELRLDGGGPVALPPELPVLMESWPGPPGGTLFLRVERDDRGRANYSMGRRATPSIKKALRWIGEAVSWLGTRGTAGYTGLVIVEADALLPYRAIHPLLRETASHKQIMLEIGTEMPHPRVMLQDRLPNPGSGGLIRRFSYDLTTPDVTPVTLPLASSAREDKSDDPDDRLILILDAAGAIHCHGATFHLDDLVQRLQAARRRYDLKMRSCGRSGEEDLGPGSTWSRLYVLIRADHEAPWHVVAALLDLLRAKRFHKFQLGVRRYATLDHSLEEAALVGVERIDLWSSDLTGFDSKLPLFSRTSPPEESERFIDVGLTAGGRFHIGDVETPDLGRVRKLIRKRQESPELRSAGIVVTGRVTAREDTPFRLVVAALDAFYRCGLERVILK